MKLLHKSAAVNAVDQIVSSEHVSRSLIAHRIAKKGLPPLFGRRASIAERAAARRVEPQLSRGFGGCWSALFISNVIGQTVNEFGFDVAGRIVGHNTGDEVVGDF